MRVTVITTFIKQAIWIILVHEVAVIHTHSWGSFGGDGDECDIIIIPYLIA